MKIGYARVSTQDRDLALQLDALKETGCEQTYQEKITGSIWIDLRGKAEQKVKSAVLKDLLEVNV